jgi:hypothetical protein
MILDPDWLVLAVLGLPVVVDMEVMDLMKKEAVVVDMVPLIMVLEGQKIKMECLEQ